MNRTTIILTALSILFQIAAIVGSIFGGDIAHPFVWSAFAAIGYVGIFYFAYDVISHRHRSTGNKFLWVVCLLCLGVLASTAYWIVEAYPSYKVTKFAATA